MAAMKATRTRCAIDGLAPVYTKAEDAGADFLEYFREHFRIHIVSESEDGLELVCVRRGSRPSPAHR